MRIINKDSCLDDVVQLINQKCKYQKVLFCLDGNSDMRFIDNIIDSLDRSVVVLKYYYTPSNVGTFLNMVNSAVRGVVYAVETRNFFKLQNNNNFVFNIFISSDNFVLPYINNVESVYAENLLVCDANVKDYTTLIFMYKLALDKLWGLLLQGNNVDTEMFKNIDKLANCGSDFYRNLLNMFNIFKMHLNEDYCDVDVQDLPYYVCLQLSAILNMLESINNQTEQYVDFYKEGLSKECLDKAYSLLLRNEIIDIIKLNNINLIKLTRVIMGRIKVLIKKHFNIKSIKLNKLKKIIKNQSSALNIDNLLYISYIFNTI